MLGASWIDLTRRARSTSGDVRFLASCDPILDLISEHVIFRVRAYIRMGAEGPFAFRHVILSHGLAQKRGSAQARRSWSDSRRRNPDVAMSGKFSS